MNNAPIGFYDSGVGGISVLRETRKLLQQEQYVYYGDFANAPYGTKTEAEIMELSMDCGRFLHAQGVKMIVVACNTATSIVIDRMRKEFLLPVVSIEPAIKPAFEQSDGGDVIVMATPATLAQSRYRRLVERFADHERLIHVPCAGLSELIDTGNLRSAALQEYLREKLLPYQGRRVDGIVIGCTHYTFVADQIQELARQFYVGECAIFDGASGVARRVRYLLQEQNLCNDSTERGEVALFASGGEENCDTMRRFL